MANNNLPVISYMTKDYEGFRSDLINLIPALLPEWTDYSESDPGITIIELLSYGMDILSYYQDRQANETYLPTATQRQSVIDACARIGYRLSTAIPAQTTLVFTITPQSVDYKIAAGYQVATQPTPYQPSVIFETSADLVIPAGNVGTEKDSNGNYLYSVKAVQGVSINNEALGTSNGQPNQTFTLKNPGVIIDGTQGSSLQIYVGGVLWTDVTSSSVPFTSNGQQYNWTIDANDYLTVKFGDGSYGNIPAQSSAITAYYRVGGGVLGNVGANTLTVPITQISAVLSVTNNTAGTDGVDQESIAHAQQYAPLALKTGDRAVTKADFATLAGQQAGVALANSWTKSSTSNTVYVSIAPSGGGNPSTDLTNSVFSVLDNAKTITTTVVMRNPLYLTARATITAQVASNISNSQTHTLIQQALQNAMAFGQMQYGQGQYLSAIYQLLSSIPGIQYSSISRFTVNPRVDTVQSTGNPTWSTISTGSNHTMDGLWKVQMTSATAFTVYYDSAGVSDISGDSPTWVQDGTGTMGTQYNSATAGSNLSFTLTAGGIAAANGDYWTFRASPYVGNIVIQESEILGLDADVVITVNGGTA